MSSYFPLDFSKRLAIWMAALWDQRLLPKRLPSLRIVTPNVKPDNFCHTAPFEKLQNVNILRVISCRSMPHTPYIVCCPLSTTFSHFIAVRFTLPIEIRFLFFLTSSLTFVSTLLLYSDSDLLLTGSFIASLLFASLLLLWLKAQRASSLSNGPWLSPPP